MPQKGTQDLSRQQKQNTSALSGSFSSPSQFQALTTSLNKLCLSIWSRCAPSPKYWSLSNISWRVPHCLHYFCFTLQGSQPSCTHSAVTGIRLLRLSLSFCPGSGISWDIFQVASWKAGAQHCHRDISRATGAVTNAPPFPSCGLGVPFPGGVPGLLQSQPASQTPPFALQLWPPALWCHLRWQKGLGHGWWDAEQHQPSSLSLWSSAVFHHWLALHEVWQKAYS